MKRNFFLTSVLVLAGLIRPAMAETFPADGYMLEDKTYENAATYTNTGVYEGEVNATAEYTDNIYKIAAGMYLPKESETAATCKENYFCTGMTDAMYSESSDQGITACPGGYPNSAAGAGAQNQCYTACTLATANIAHATAVDGNDYYGDGADTCVATDCDPGYHVNNEIKMIDKAPVVPVDYTINADAYAYITAAGRDYSYRRDDTGTFISETFGADLTEPNTWAVHYDSGIVYGRASCQPGIPAGYEYYMNNMEAVAAGTMTYEAFESGLADIIGELKAAYVTSVVRHMVTSMGAGNVEPDEATMTMYTDIVFSVLMSDSATEPDANLTGEHCYCQITGYTPSGGSFESAKAAPWLYESNQGSSCGESCARFCGTYFMYKEVPAMYYRNAMMGVRGLEVGGTCAANDITINWTDAEEIGDAGMCKYGGDIKTPVKAVTKKGKTFKGWRFEKTN